MKMFLDTFFILSYKTPLKNILLILILFLSLESFSDYQSDMDYLKKSKQNFEPDGAICEVLSKRRFQDLYPTPAFTVLNGVEYSDQQKTIGELDIVVYDNVTQQVQVIVEVKCWKDPKGGLKKAHEQRQRFLHVIRSGYKINFNVLDQPDLKISSEQFVTTRQFIAIGQLGTTSYGFDLELEYSLKELIKMRKELLDCQAYNLCEKPE